MRLLSGTDVRGTALPGAGEPVNLTEDAVRDIAAAFADTLREAGAAVPRVALGADSRLSSPALKAAAAEALTAAGCHVLDLGMASTPAMFMATLPSMLGCDGSVMVTASHLPAHRNGLKFFRPEGGLEAEEVKDLLTRAEAGPRTRCPGGFAETAEFMPRYAAFLVEKVRAELGEERPLAGLHIVTDAGNGVGGFFAPLVLEPLGADTAGSVLQTPDGRFPAHIPNPEDPAAMASIREAVLASGADLGLIFDTDCDRAAVVESSGHEINRNRLIALVAAMVLRHEPGAAIVTDSVTCAGLPAFIEGLGGRHVRSLRGYRNVINDARRLSAPVAVETSGHCAFRDNYFLDDGAYLMTLILIEAARLRRQGKTLSDLTRGLKEPAEEAEVRLAIQREDFAAYGAHAVETLRAWAGKIPGCDEDTGNRDGIRLLFDAEHGDGWCLLRLSRHDPVMPLNLESDTAGGVERIAAALSPLLSTLDGLDLSALRALKK